MPLQLDFKAIAQGTPSSKAPANKQQQLALTVAKLEQDIATTKAKTLAAQAVIASLLNKIAAARAANEAKKASPVKAEVQTNADDESRRLRLSPLEYAIYKQTMEQL